MAHPNGRRPEAPASATGRVGALGRGTRGRGERGGARANGVPHGTSATRGTARGTGDGAARRRSLPVRDGGLYLAPEAEGALQNRLSRMEGQVRGVKRMLAAHESCDDILVQVSALKQAVNAVAALLVQAHMETCVLARVEAGEGKAALTSLRSALTKVMKHG